jgi:hypothetical protein
VVSDEQFALALKESLQLMGPKAESREIEPSRETKANVNPKFRTLPPCYFLILILDEIQVISW